MPKTLAYVNHEVAQAQMPEGREPYARVRRALVLDMLIQHNLHKHEELHRTLRSAIGSVASAHLSEQLAPPLPEDLAEVVLSVESQNVESGTRVDVGVMRMVLEAVHEHGYRSDG